MSLQKIMPSMLGDNFLNDLTWCHMFIHSTRKWTGVIWQIAFTLSIHICERNQKTLHKSLCSLWKGCWHSLFFSACKYFSADGDSISFIHFLKCNALVKWCDVSHKSTYDWSSHQKRKMVSTHYITHHGFSHKNSQQHNTPQFCILLQLILYS